MCALEGKGSTALACGTCRMSAEAAAEARRLAAAGELGALEVHAAARSVSGTALLAALAVAPEAALCGGGGGGGPGGNSRTRALLASAAAGGALARGEAAAWCVERALAVDTRTGQLEDALQILLAGEQIEADADAKEGAEAIDESAEAVTGASTAALDAATVRAAPRRALAALSAAAGQLHAAVYALGMHGLELGAFAALDAAGRFDALMEGALGEDADGEGEVAEGSSDEVDDEALARSLGAVERAARDACAVLPARAAGADSRRLVWAWAERQLTLEAGDPARGVCRAARVVAAEPPLLPLDGELAMAFQALVIAATEDDARGRVWSAVGAAAEAVLARCFAGEHEGALRAARAARAGAALARAGLRGVAPADMVRALDDETAARGVLARAYAAGVPPAAAAAATTECFDDALASLAYADYALAAGDVDTAVALLRNLAGRAYAPAAPSAATAARAVLARLQSSSTTLREEEGAGLEAALEAACELLSLGLTDAGLAAGDAAELLALWQRAVMRLQRLEEGEEADDQVRRRAMWAKSVSRRHHRAHECRTYAFAFVYRYACVRAGGRVRVHLSACVCLWRKDR